MYFGFRVSRMACWLVRYLEPVRSMGRGFIKEFARDRSGAVLVEFAFVLPLFLLLTFGAVAWGYTISISDAMFDAARQGARELAVGTSDETAAAASTQAVLANWPSTSFTVVAEDTTTTGTNDVKVTVSTTNLFVSMFPFVPMPADLQAEVTMRRE